MRRIIIIGIALAALAGGTAAWASSDPNTYSGSISVSPAKAGKLRKPVIDAWTQTINASSNQSGFNTAPLKDIRTLIYGLKVDTKTAHTCSSAKIESSLGTACSNAVVATGSVQSQLGSSSRQGPTAPCNPNLKVFNGGKNYVWFFFIVPNPQACPAQTGSAQPYKGTFSRFGKYLVFNVPLPGDVSTNAGGLGLFASLTHEHLVWKKISKRIDGKRVGYFSSFACKAGKRPFKVTYTDTTSQSGTTAGSTTQSGKLAC